MGWVFVIGILSDACRSREAGALADRSMTVQTHLGRHNLRKLTRFIGMERFITVSILCEERYEVYGVYDMGLAGFWMWIREFIVRHTG